MFQKNAAYIKEQLRRVKLRLPQPDFWMDDLKEERMEGIDDEKGGEKASLVLHHL